MQQTGRKPSDQKQREKSPPQILTPKRQKSIQLDLNNPQPSPTKIIQNSEPRPKVLSKTITNFRSNSLINLGELKKSNSKNIIIRNTVTREENRHERNTSNKNSQLASQGSSKAKTKSNQPKPGSVQPSKQFKTSTNKSKSSYKTRKTTPLVPFTLNSKKSVPDQIIDYINKRQQVQIVQYFQEYKKQFYIKARTLHDYIQSTQQPEKIKNTYLNESDNHFRNGLESIMLKLYRNGTIVPQSWTNLRQEAVDQIQKWVIGWIHRKITYGKLSEDEENQVLMTEDAIKQMDQYRRQINNEDTSF